MVSTIILPLVNTLCGLCNVYGNIFCMHVMHIGLIPAS